MKCKASSILFFLLMTIFVTGQQKESKGDFLFFEFAYAEAIKAYNKEMTKYPLSNQQVLNLADAYLRTNKHQNAADNYLKVFETDSTMSSHYFNKMLQSISKSSGLEYAKGFMITNNEALTPELKENANFNFALLESNENNQLDYKIFNVRANSSQSDLSPTFFKDKFLFSSTRPKLQKKRNKIYAPSGESYMDVYLAQIDAEGNVHNPISYDGLPDSKYHKGTPFYSEELDEIFYILSNADGDKLSFDDNGKNSLALGKAQNKVSFEYLLRDLSTNFYYPFYDATNKKLYFAANFEDSLGGTDIYFVYTNNGQIMSAPVNLGPRINTAGNEIAPFIFENSLYFSSDIFYGLGGMDIYKSNISKDDYYSIPINLGKGINSPSDDFGFIIKNDDFEGLIGYFSSNREGGKGNDDIYGFKVAEKPGLKTFAIEGTITNGIQKSAISKVQITLLNKEGNVLTEVYTDKNGKYRAEVPWEEYITVRSVKERYSVFSKAYEGEEMEMVQKEPLNITVVALEDVIAEKEDQTILKLNKFYFSRGKYQLTETIQTELDKVVYAISSFPKLQLRIESHTNSKGGTLTNFRLSQKRADAIKKYLLEKGVPSSNILYSIGYGEDKLVNKCKNGVFCIEYLHKQNERHLIAIINYNLLY